MYVSNQLLLGIRVHTIISYGPIYPGGIAVLLLLLFLRQHLRKIKSGRLEANQSHQRDYRYYFGGGRNAVCSTNSDPFTMQSYEVSQTNTNTWCVAITAFHVIKM